MKGLLRFAIFALACKAPGYEAFANDKWLRFYDCDNEYQARSCQGCKLDKDVQVKFAVARRSSGHTVISYMKEGWWTNHPPVDLAKNGACDVIDNNNWSCLQEGVPEGSSHMKNLIGKREMSNGIYFRHTSFFNPRSGRLVERFSCAK